ncbi:hypothetical protein M501DRAFT_1056443 [Patellaria atrata CBS 101060]|uniref:Uncharacterized protein n=1 Tax=Patellaria atrata CBS 101060 TaxID=1346257 RepID=A0A9P4SCS0_9PEZI|nr:hypothetical protein M501DRAFT_1056443 [Patellaria atrata CBS 101060]
MSTAWRHYADKALDALETELNKLRSTAQSRPSTSPCGTDPTPLSDPDDQDAASETSTTILPPYGGEADKRTKLWKGEDRVQPRTFKAPVPSPSAHLTSARWTHHGPHHSFGYMFQLHMLCDPQLLRKPYAEHREVGREAARVSIRRFLGDRDVAFFVENAEDENLVEELVGVWMVLHGEWKGEFGGFGGREGLFLKGKAEAVYRTFVGMREEEGRGGAGRFVELRLARIMRLSYDYRY